MNDKIKKGITNNIWKIIIGIISLGFLLLAGSVAAYFLYILPSQEAEKIEFEKQKYEQTIKEKEERKKAEEEEARSNKQKLDSCIFDAELNYSDNWDEYCAIWKAEVKDTYEDCKLNFAYMGTQEAKDFCWANTPDYNESDNGSCLLPNKYSEIVENRLDENKQECYKKYS